MAAAVEVEAAAARIAGHVLRTPVLWSRPLSARTGVSVLLKLESEQTTGSFKIRGATNRLLVASGEERTRGFVTASSGNHGLAMATALDRLGLPGAVVLPTNAAPTKRAALAQFAGLEVLLHGDDCVDAELHARQLAQATGRVFVSPYNDAQVMAGQGTVAVELLEQAPEVDAVFITVGGGGLAGGMATWIKHARPQCRVIGCQPAASPVMHESVKAGHIVQYASADSLADGSAGGIEEGSITLDPCTRYIDTWVAVSEAEIAAAMRTMLDDHHKVVEGAAGVALAALLKTHAEYRGKTVAVVLCGSNVGTDVLRSLLTMSL